MLQPHEIEQIRKVYDEDAKGRKMCSIASPREDAVMFRSSDRHVVPCECIVELYELLWRWSHRSTGQKDFAQNFGFAIPDTIVVVKGKPYAWYFVSKKDGALLRKSEGSLNFGAVEKKFCRGDDDSALCAVWLPMASQFPEVRCHSQYAEYLTVAACRDFVGGMRQSHSGILQQFVEPHGVSNALIRTVQFRDQTSLCVRTNRARLADGKGNLFDRCATFEGWEGLSSSSSRYRSHRHPQMEELILAAGETLNQRIEQERVRQMLFLDPTQHVALHFKVAKDDQLYFIYASIVSEKEVILQTRPQLLMGDPCMTEDLRGMALLPGGTERKALPRQYPTFMMQQPGYDSPSADSLAEGSVEKLQEPPERTLRALPPIRQPLSARGPREGLPPAAQEQEPLSAREPREGRRRRQLSQERGHQGQGTVLPTMSAARPAVPDVPYQMHSLPHSLSEAGRYDGYLPPYLGIDVVKRPLISSTMSTRSEQGSLSARGHLSSARSEPVRGSKSSPRGRQGRPPLAPS